MFFELFVDPVRAIKMLLQDASFWLFVAFILFILLLGRRIWAALQAALDQYAATIKSDINTAAHKRKIAAETLTAARNEHLKAQAKAAAILEHAERESERIRTEMEHDLESFLQSRERIIDERIKNLETKAAKEMRDRSIRIGVKAAQIVLQQKVTPEMDARFINQAIDELEKEQICVN